MITIFQAVIKGDAIDTYRAVYFRWFDISSRIEREGNKEKKSTLRGAMIARRMQTKMKDDDKDGSIERKRVYHFVRILTAMWKTLVASCVTRLFFHETHTFIYNIFTS